VASERLEGVEAGLAPIAVREHEQAGTRAVLEVVADALLLQEARHEGEGALVVLHAVGPHPDIVDAAGASMRQEKRSAAGSKVGARPSPSVTVAPSWRERLGSPERTASTIWRVVFSRKMRQRVRCPARTRGGARSTRYRVPSGTRPSSSASA